MEQRELQSIYNAYVNEIIFNICVENLNKIEMKGGEC